MNITEPDKTFNKIVLYDWGNKKVIDINPAGYGPTFTLIYGLDFSIYLFRFTFVILKERLIFEFFKEKWNLRVKSFYE